MSDYAEEINAAVCDVARRHRDHIDAILAALPIGATLCVHDGPRAGDWRPDSDVFTFTIRAKVHVLAAGETCNEPVQRGSSTGR